MLYCFNPNCTEIQNPDGQNFCVSCGSPLLLKERYHAVKLLGSGGFGRTFQGVDIDNAIASRKNCAIKQLYIPNISGSTRQKVLELFERESQWLYQLEEHPQTPNFIDYFSEKDNFYLIQELIIGKTLAEEIRERQTPYQEVEVLCFLQEVIIVLKYIHQYKIIHRDLKPDNFIHRDIDKKWILIDFGASRILSETALIGGATIIGTPEYMAPEQHRGKVLPASDLYSLGVICVQMITGKSTLDMFDIQTNTWSWQKYIPEESQLSLSFINLINNMIAPSLGERLQSALQVEQIVRQIERRKYPNKFSTQSTLSPTAKEIYFCEQSTVPMIENDALGQPILEQPLPTKSSKRKTNFTENNQLDFQLLIQNLQRHHWQAADNETWFLINRAISKNRHSFLFMRDILQIPCKLLWEIDQLWLQYSKHHFGFSKQLEIYLVTHGDYLQFCHQLCWLVQGSGNLEKDFMFQLEAPVGHLPSRQKIGGSASVIWKNTEVFYEHLIECGF